MEAIFGILFFMIAIGAALFYIFIPLLIAIISLIERQTIHKLQPLNLDQEKKLISKTKNLISDAISNNFTLCGYFTDGDKGILEAFVSISISHDQRTILWIERSLDTKYKFISELDNGQWIITSDISSIIDLSNTDLEVMLPGVETSDVYQYHLERLMEYSPRVVLLKGNDFPDKHYAHRQAKLEKSMALGYMKFVNAEKSKAVYTLKGAVGVAQNSFVTNVKALQQHKLAGKKKSFFYEEKVLILSQLTYFFKIKTLK